MKKAERETWWLYPDPPAERLHSESSSSKSSRMDEEQIIKQSSMVVLCVESAIKTDQQKKSAKHSFVWLLERKGSVEKKI
jgi:hypothetical protein